MAASRALSRLRSSSLNSSSSPICCHADSFPTITLTSPLPMPGISFGIDVKLAVPFVYCHALSIESGQPVTAGVPLVVVSSCPHMLHLRAVDRGDVQLLEHRPAVHRGLEA